MNFKRRTINEIAEMVCGNGDAETCMFKYRSSFFITQFFQDSETEYVHDGSHRVVWVTDTLEAILAEPSIPSNSPPDTFLRVIDTLMDQADAQNEGNDRSEALSILNASLSREGFEAFYGEDLRCYLRHTNSKTVICASPNPHRPMSSSEIERRNQLVEYLDGASEDDLIEEVLLPLFRQLGFQRITAAGHKDKALEYGKDIWMRYVLPTQHVLYFGIQVKKGKLNSAGAARSGNANIAEIYNQVSMMIGHEIFDPEINRKVLVDHVLIIAGREITKAARNWLGGKLDATRRSQILFMDREDILNLFVVTNTSLPKKELPDTSPTDDEIPF